MKLAAANPAAEKSIAAFSLVEELKLTAVGEEPRTVIKTVAMTEVSPSLSVSLYVKESDPPKFELGE